MKADAAMSSYDAVIIGSGPNGLAAAVELARAGRTVKVFEGHETIGGGTRTMELTLPGFRHDVCSAVHPLGLGSPFFRELPLEDHGLRWVHPPVPFAHAYSPKEAVLAHRSVTITASELGGTDAEEYVHRIQPLLDRWDKIEPHILGPVLRFPRHPLAMARFGWVGVLPARTLVNAFTTEAGRALIAGSAAHAYLPFNRMLGASYGLLYPVTAHRYGWPFAAGGSQAIGDALASYLRSLGGEIETGRWVRTMRDLPESKVVLADVTPEVLLGIGGGALPQGYRKKLARFRRAPGAFKVDYALAGPVPWLNARLEDAGTIHVGTAESIAEGEAAIWKGKRPKRPFLLIAQPSRFDPTRAPDGRHTLWVYAHVPFGTDEDYTPAIEAELEALAPGFKDLVLDRCIAGPADLEAYNPNYAGGDITGGAHTLSQILFRPFPGGSYRTPMDGVYLCSASTPPGAGVHGMCGYWAARQALGRELR
ncbi:MAG TPA: NAD(P)/FAD-dependent oxidoreductase [Acidimicrobiia bacterium]|nr:NAD(P)/FAD-dependent oxidoreductase [Acidimicrobiia bacterium]